MWYEAEDGSGYNMDNVININANRNNSKYCRISFHTVGWRIGDDCKGTGSTLVYVVFQGSRWQCDEEMERIFTAIKKGKRILMRKKTPMIKRVYLKANSWSRAFKAAPVPKGQS